MNPEHQMTGAGCIIPDSAFTTLDGKADSAGWVSKAWPGVLAWQ